MDSDKQVKHFFDNGNFLNLFSYLIINNIKKDTQQKNK